MRSNYFNGNLTTIEYQSMAERYQIGSLFCGLGSCNNSRCENGAFLAWNLRSFYIQGHTRWECNDGSSHSSARCYGFFRNIDHRRQVVGTDMSYSQSLTSNCMHGFGHHGRPKAGFHTKDLESCSLDLDRIKSTQIDSVFCHEAGAQIAVGC